MTMGQESSRNGDDLILNKYYPQLNPKKDAFSDHYVLENVVLGEGITGKVYKCKSRSDPSSPVFALKALPKNGKTVREVVLHKRMQSGCQYIVQIKDVIENVVRGREILFVVMELMAGGELFTAISSRYPDKPFSEREVAQLVLCVCTAVKHLHDNGIAHRDLKPENLLFSSSDAREAIIKLTDFGFAKESVDSLKTPNFTPYYGAPEVLQKVRLEKRMNDCSTHNSNQPPTQQHLTVVPNNNMQCMYKTSSAPNANATTYSLSCDMWSLGVIIYIMLSGYPPFYNSQGREVLTPTMRNSIIEGRFRFPREHGWQHVSDAPKNLIRNLLVVNPEDRLSIDQVMQNPWLNNFHDVPNSPLDAAGHHSVLRHGWGEIMDVIANPPNVYRTNQRIILQPACLHPLFLKRLPRNKAASTLAINVQTQDESTPEVIRSKGTDTHSYDKSCDCWSLGVIIYILLCGYPPFYSRRGMAMSPGMRDHIVKGEYRFPDREWQRISREAKELVQRLLVVDPKKRATIDNIMKDPWILSHRKLPDVPLGSADILHSEKPNWEEMRQGMSQQLESMRTDARVNLNPVSRNKLFQKRVKVGQTPTPIQESQSSIEGGSSSPTPSGSGTSGQLVAQAATDEVTMSGDTS